MGSSTFSIIETGKTARDAFKTAVKQAQYDHGHAGYTGTIAEKTDFIMLTVPAGETWQKYSKKLLDTQGSPIDSKWGPAGCIDLGGGNYAFFGWASS